MNAGDEVTGTTGVLNYDWNHYAIYLDPGSTTRVPVLTSYIPVTAPTADELTVASMNLQRLFDTTDDGMSDEPAVTTRPTRAGSTRYADAICNTLHTPDIIGVQEAETPPSGDTDVLRALATQIQARVQLDVHAIRRPRERRGRHRQRLPGEVDGDRRFSLAGLTGELYRRPGTGDPIDLHCCTTGRRSSSWARCRPSTTTR